MSKKKMGRRMNVMNVIWKKIPGNIRKNLALLSIPFTVGVLALNSCESQPDPAPATGAGPNHLWTESGLPADKKEIKLLSLTHHNPEKAENWSASFKRENPATKEWSIVSGPDGTSLADHRANGLWIEHFLDELAVVTRDSVAAPATAETYGFEPPRDRVQLSTEAREFVWTFGLPASRSEVFAKLSGKSEAFQVHGSAIEMLRDLTGFQALRDGKLSTISEDDVDEFELWTGTKKHLYAQRDGEKWTGEKHEKTKLDAKKLIEIITHVEIAQFIDDVKACLPAKTFREWEFKLFDRHRKETTLKLVEVADSKAIAFESTRPNACFTIHSPEIFALLP
jgi:hypothetical protein